MPSRTKKAVEIEVNNRMVDFREKNDHKGLVDYMENVLDLNMTAGQLDPENAENNEHYFAYDKMLNLLAPMVFNDESRDFYVRVRAEIAKRAIDEHVRFINKSKELEKRVLNEEIEDAEYLKHDKKLLAKTGLALGFDGRRVYDLQCFDGMSRAALVAEGMAEIDINEYYNVIEESTKLLKNHPDVPKGEEEFYKSALPENIPTNKYKVGKGIEFDIKKLGQKNPICDEAAYIKKLKGIKTAEELEEYRKEVLKDKQLLLDYENAALKMSRETKPLFDELKAKAKEPASKEYQTLYESLENLGNVGNGLCLLDHGTNSLGETKESIIRHKAIKALLDFLEKNGKAFEKEDPEFAKKIQDFANSNKEQLHDLNTKNVVSVQKRFRPSVFPVIQSSSMDKVLADIDVRKEQLEMKKYCPEQTASLKKMREDCARRNEKIDTVEDYISSARRVKKALKFLQDDISKDNTERGGGSGSYNNFVSTLDKLFKMDPETTKPREYIAQMNFALGAAETYVSKHQGFAHPFSARLPKGAERFDKARLVRDILSLKIKEFEAKHLTNCSFLDKDPKKELESLNAENDALRLSCKAKEQEIKELTAFRRAKEEFTELAANIWLKNKFDDTLAEHFAQHTEYTPEQIQNIKDTTSFEDYKNETKAQVLGNEQFKKFIDSIKDKQTLERMSSLAQGDGRGLYDSINTFAYNSNEKLSFLDEKIKAAQKSIDELSDNGRSINDQALKNDYAVIATAYYYKLAKKTGADEINDAAFNRKLEEIKGSKILSDMIVQDKGKTLYDQATADKGQNLWRNFFDRFEMQKKQGEIVKEHSASNTVIKEAGKGTLDLK